MAEVHKVQVRDGGIVTFLDTGISGLEGGVSLTLGQAKFWRDEMDRAIRLIEDAYALGRAREASALRQKQQKKQELLAIAERLRALGIPDEPDATPPDDLAGFGRSLGAIILEVGAQ